MLLLTRRDVARLMPFGDYVVAVADAFRRHAAGDCAMPAPVHIPGHDGGFHVKAAGLALGRNYVAVKINGNFPLNPSRNSLPTIQGAIFLADGADGRPLALMDSIEITINRTAAATALAARHLARPDSTTALICGCGAQGRSQVLALRHALPITHVRAFDLDYAKAAAFAAGIAAELGIAADVVPVLSEAARTSDVIVTCTPARRPILLGGDVASGTFIAAVGADSHDKQELDSKLLVGAKLVVDILEQCATIGELHHALDAGLLAPEAVHAELGEIMAGTKPGRTSRDEITIFDSTGAALQDVVAAAAVFERAVRAGVGYACELN
ncbi:MAG: ornithine cyclodeaminase family protein [Proteobacteria bacterium]|nr:ornithine cyclodeaminase family protein [Pseudomonadota bacterium]